MKRELSVVNIECGEINFIVVLISLMFCISIACKEKLLIRIKRNNFVRNMDYYIKTEVVKISEDHICSSPFTSLP